MSNVECNVVRDLMPLCIDDVASEDSCNYVHGHIAACEACARIYDEMGLELTRSNEEKERMAMEQAAKRMRSRRIRRSVLGIMMAVLLIVAAVAAWRAVENRLYSMTEATQLDKYSAFVLQTQDGKGFVVVKSNEERLTSVGLAKHYRWPGINGYDKHALEIEIRESLVPKYPEGDEANSQLLWRTVFEGTIAEDGWHDPSFRGQEENVVWDEIAIISGDERIVIYRHGDTVPFCSPEMEEYAQCYTGFRPSNLSYPEWRVQLVEMLLRTPEWQ